MRAVLLTGLLLTPVWTLANDTSAVLSTGGLEFVSNPDIVMQSEDLFISRDEVRVVYEFRNDGTSDQTVLVAFPMPDIVPSFYSPVAYPSGPDDNLFQFETRFNGEPVRATLHEYAFAHGVDRSDIVRQLGLPMVPISQAAQDATEALPPESLAELLHLGMAAPDAYDVGNGMEQHYFPTWTYRAAYTWEAVFPAGEVVTVEHRYTPSVGGTVGVSFLYPADEMGDPTAEYARKYCTDDDFVAAVRASLSDPDELWSAPYTETWLSYILTTGSNWAGNGIERFRLVVDKGDPKNLVSFCGTDVKKIGPTTFEMVEENFWPDRELEILILEHRGEP